MFRSKFSNLEFSRPFKSHVKAIFEVKCHVHDDWEGGVLKSFPDEIQTHYIKRFWLEYRLIARASQG